MTRLAVLADIHGNLPALQAVIDDMKQFDVDHVVVAGDSVNWGPFSREVLELVFQRRWALIRGNNAFYALDYGTVRAPDFWSSFSLPPILREQLGESAGSMRSAACPTHFRCASSMRHLCAFSTAFPTIPGRRSSLAPR